MVECRWKKSLVGKVQWIGGEGIGVCAVAAGEVGVAAGGGSAGAIGVWSRAGIVCRERLSLGRLLRRG
ncbi:MAG: hypothetical protein LBB15_02165 [Puniceicoccales bacterium]|nr:hypothetical protein [Puniceicoccales bacterium]